MTTKIHALVDALGNPVEVMLSPGQAHDLACAQALIEEADPAALIGDKAFDSDPFIAYLAERGITPVIPPRANRTAPRECDYALYCERSRALGLTVAEGIFAADMKVSLVNDGPVTLCLDSRER